MARRPPMKIAPSPSETPEHDAVRERERSSEAVQAKLREERNAPKVAAPAEVVKDQTPTPKPATKAKRAKQTPKPAAPKTTVTAKPVAPAPAASEDSSIATKQVEQRISVGVPISLATLNAMEHAATKLGTDVDYIKRALAPKARVAFLERAAANDLKSTSKAMKLLFEQRLDNGVAVMPVKLAIDADIERKSRSFIADPLDAISVNRLVAAFVGAEFEGLVAAL